MNRCPITYLPCGSDKYSPVGLRLLSPSLKQLKDLPFSAVELRREAALRMKKMSIQGVQPKLSAVLKTRNSIFEIVDLNGNFIIKPQSADFEQLPENEDVTMKMGKAFGIKVPLHGLIYSADGSLNYFIKRFDRLPKKQKLAVEDFAQLASMSRDTKYRFSTEKMINLIEEYCTFPVVEKIKFFKLLLFAFITGNEDLHLKNFSLITRKGIVEFSPGYDLLNTTLAMEGAEEELALSLKCKKNNFKRSDFFDYFAKERLELKEVAVLKIETELIKCIPAWKALISKSFLTEEKKNTYIKMLNNRTERILKK